MYHVCKACGRGLRTDEKPNFCYADRMDHLENISDEDSAKMGLHVPRGTFEFPGDVRWDPITGEPTVPEVGGRTMAEWQDEIMEKMRV